MRDLGNSPRKDNRGIELGYKMHVTSSTITRPWYRMRWQIWLPSLFAVVFSAIVYLQVNKPPQISISSGPIGQNKTLKERMIFVVILEKSFHKKGWPASLDLEGEDGKTLKIYWDQLSLSLVKQIISNDEIVADIRGMGFRHLIMTTGKESWDIDLKN